MPTPDMPRLRHITIDCADPYTLSRFWAKALGFADDPEDLPQVTDREVGLLDPLARHPMLLFIAVPEPKAVKNRIHLDIQPVDTRDATVATLLGHGATLVDDQRLPDGRGWVVLADPEGNEFCVERSEAERGRPVGGQMPDEDFPPGIFVADELELLSTMLEWYRAAVLRKVADLSLRTARTSPVRTGTTLAGVLKHLAGVEDAWFDGRFAGSPEPEPWASMPPDDREWDFTSALDDSLDDLVELYRTSCARSRRAAADHGLDDLSANARRPFNLRFAYLHLIEETARHLGHMDILREYLDGTTGE
ncbi:MAG: hypothetical protein JWN39_971 [Ilumatobacteraceae bacterium]|nr:hypothetical protein [Ilumatobacteraceae bacterium]